MTEVKAAAGADMPGDLGAEMLGFVSELKAFRSDIQKRLEAQEDRMTMLDRKTLSRARAPLSAEADAGAPHQKAFDAYVRHGDDGALSGDGTNKPKGFLTHARAANATATNVQIGTIASGATGDFAATNPTNALIDLVYALGAQYRANATFVMNSKTAAAVRKMRDTDGRFLWADSLAMGQPPQLLGYPVLLCEDMPDIANGSASIAFGDFKSGYTIVERPDLRVLRDPFSAKPHVLFYATKRVGGGVTDARAIKLMVFG